MLASSRSPRNGRGSSRSGKSHHRTKYLDGKRTAGLRFGDTLRSLRSTSGIFYHDNVIAWAEHVLQAARADGILELEVVITNGATYRVDLATMLERGELRQTPAGTQRALPLNCWTVTGGKAKPASFGPESEKPAQTVQLSLFGGAS